MSDGFYHDGRLDYPTAERLVARYIAEKSPVRDRATSVDVLRWADRENTEHNRRRVRDALADRCPRVGTWAGRAAFGLPGGSAE